MARFTTKNGDLYIDFRKVLKGWESFSGWYWFGVEKAYKQDSMIDNKICKDDQIWYGFVQGLEEEWGYFSQGEIENLSPKTWKIPKENLHFSGRRE